MLEPDEDPEEVPEPDPEAVPEAEPLPLPELERPVPLPVEQTPARQL